MCTKRFHEVCILLSSKSFALISWITRDVDSAREHIPAVWRRENPPSFPESFSFPPFLLLPALYAFSFSNKPKCRPPTPNTVEPFLLTPSPSYCVFSYSIGTSRPTRRAVKRTRSSSVMPIPGL